MKFIKLFHVPFGDVFLNVDAIGAIEPAGSDPGNDGKAGCCVIVHGEEFRVEETAEQVMALILADPSLSVLADPEPSPKELAFQAEKKGKKRGK